MSETFAAYLLAGMGDDMEAPAPMTDETMIVPIPELPTLSHREIVHRRFATGQYASAADMQYAGWAMSYDLDGYGRLFGRWPEGADPVALVPVREVSA